MVATLPEYINLEYVAERVRRFNENPSDDLLYRIARHADVLPLVDGDVLEEQDGLTPEQRFRVLNWIISTAGLEIQGDLALLIFGRSQLTQWLERSLFAYPDYEFYLVFEFHPQHQSGWESGINFSMHWTPKPGAPEPSVGSDFPWKLYWESGDMFWNDWMPNGNQFDFGLSCYPNQQSFATPNSFCVEGDRYTTLTSEEASLMSVAQVLESSQRRRK
jgi:hypothetical protein